MDDQVQDYRDRLDSAGDRGLDFGQGDKPGRGGRRNGRRGRTDAESDSAPAGNDSDENDDNESDAGREAAD